MIKHYMILASAYSIGKRIVLHFPEEDEKSVEKLLEAKNFIYDKYGKDAPISMHMVQTHSLEWSSVVKLDKFFKNTLLLDTKEEFVELLIKDSEISSIDLAQYILSIVPCTHLKLQKLVYMCYADYLCEENKKMFDDIIYAYQYGPIIFSVYQKYKKSGKNKLLEDDKLIYDREEYMLSARSRILSSKNGIKKLFSINKTLEKYSNLTASELVGITHENNTPWKKAYDINKNDVLITDELIKKYHIYER